MKSLPPVSCTITRTGAFLACPLPLPLPFESTIVCPLLAALLARDRAR